MKLFGILLLCLLIFTNAYPIKDESKCLKSVNSVITKIKEEVEKRSVDERVVFILVLSIVENHHSSNFSYCRAKDELESVLSSVRSKPKKIILKESELAQLDQSISELEKTVKANNE